MKTYEATEQAYKNGYAKGYADGKKDAKKTIRDLLRRTFYVFVKTRWLKEIDKAVTKYKKAQIKVEQKRYAANVLIKAYEEKFGEGFGGKKRDGETHD